jgi:uncharacterized protein YchJ
MCKWVSFSRWWNSIVFVDTERRALSRSKLVLTAANQDGGAHIDCALDEVYHALSRQNSLRWFFTDGERQIEPGGPEKAAIRQIAHETLKSLHPAYTRFSVQKIGRNKTCPCGSGFKYKHCHGKVN